MSNVSGKYINYGICNNHFYSIFIFVLFFSFLCYILLFMQNQEVEVCKRYQVYNVTKYRITYPMSN